MLVVGPACRAGPGSAVRSNLGNVPGRYASLKAPSGRRGLLCFRL